MIRAWDSNWLQKGCAGLAAGGQARGGLFAAPPFKKWRTSRHWLWDSALDMLLFFLLKGRWIAFISMVLYQDLNNTIFKKIFIFSKVNGMYSLKCTYVISSISNWSCVHVLLFFSSSEQSWVQFSAAFSCEFRVSWWHAPRGCPWYPKLIGSWLKDVGHHSALEEEHCWICVRLLSLPVHWWCWGEGWAG